MSQKFPVYKIFGVINNEHHDRLRYKIACCFRYYTHVTVHQVTDCLNLSLELRIYRALLAALLTGLLTHHTQAHTINHNDQTAVRLLWLFQMITQQKRRKSLNVLYVRERTLGKYPPRSHLPVGAEAQNKNTQVREMYTYMQRIVVREDRNGR